MILSSGLKPVPFNTFPVIIWFVLFHPSQNARWMGHGTLVALYALTSMVFTVSRTLAPISVVERTVKP
jgi:hypothetical protein